MITFVYFIFQIGGLRTKTHTLHIEELPVHQRKPDLRLGKTQLLVARKPVNELWENLENGNIIIINHLGIIAYIFRHLFSQRLYQTKTKFNIPFSNRTYLTKILKGA